MNAICFIIGNATIQSGEKCRIAFVRQRYGRKDFRSKEGLILRTQFADGFADFGHRTH